MPKIRFNGVELYFEEYGRGKETFVTSSMFGATSEGPLSLLAAKAVPGAKAVFFQDESHMLPQESPEKVADEIKLFVTQLNRARRE